MNQQHTTQQPKPSVPSPLLPGVCVTLTGVDGNAFTIMGIVSRAIKAAGLEKEAREYIRTAIGCKDYDELLYVTMATVTVQ